jgi:hypothetical protein
LVRSIALGSAAYRYQCSIQPELLQAIIKLLSVGDRDAPCTECRKQIPPGFGRICRLSEPANAHPQLNDVNEVPFQQLHCVSNGPKLHQRFALPVRNRLVTAEMPNASPTTAVSDWHVATKLRWFSPNTHA